MSLRKAFVMSVNEGFELEYEERHNPIWEQLKKTLKEHGVSNYSIFLLPETRQLFAYVEIQSEERWNAVAATAICQEWWASMSALMPTHPDSSPISIELREVFHLD